MARRKIFHLTLTAAQYNAVCAVLSAAKQTFVNWNEEDQVWESNDDFICSLTDEEKQALMTLY